MTHPSEAESPIDSQALSSRITEFVVSTELADLPPPVVERLKKSVLDVLACGLYGSRQESVRAPLRLFLGRGGTGEATLWIDGNQVPLFEAAAFNGTLVNASEFQEGFSRAGQQPSAAITPGLLALAEREHKTGATFLAAAAVGYELVIRLGLSLTDHVGFLQRQGLGPIFDSVGAAAAGASLLRRNNREAADCLGIAAMLTPTPLMAAFQQSATVKDMNHGLGGGLGMLAVDLAAAGVTGPRDWVLPFYRALIQGYAFGPLTDRLGGYWHVASGGLHSRSKPLILGTQPIMGSLDQILAETEVRVEDIEDILTECCARARLNDIPQPTNLTGARASLQFMVAAGLTRQAELKADPYLINFLRPELLDDPEISRLAQRVRFAVDPEFDYNMESAPTEDGDHYMKFEGRLTIRLEDGRRLTGYEDVYALNGNPTRELIERKFRACADGLLDAGRQDELVQAIWHLEDLNDVAEVARLMA